VDLRITEDAVDVLTVVTTIIDHAGEMPRPESVHELLSRSMTDGSYRFFLGRDDVGQVVSCGVVTFMTLPMAEDHVLAVELLWVHGGDGEVEDLVWRALIKFAQRLDFRGVVISRYSVNNEETLSNLLQGGAVEGCPVAVEELWLQKVGNVDPVTTAFCVDEVTGAVFRSVPVAAIGTRSYFIDVAGVEYESDGPLYRGDGRLNHWACNDLRDLARTVRARGISPRPREFPRGSDKEFEGTIAEQLLHQGYVGQGAVSLSASFAIAARYATHGGNRPAGLVVKVDPHKLRTCTRVFSAEGTLARACPWIPSDAWSQFTRIVQALEGDLVTAGKLMETWHEEAWRRAEIGLGSLLPPPDLVSAMPRQAQEALSSRSIDDQDLLRAFAVFEEFAEYAQGRIGSVDSIQLGEGGSDQVDTQRVDPMAYFLVFDEIHDAIGEARPDWEVGWDDTPYGYIAKTFRDSEVLVAGAIPAQAITDCYVVRPDGTRDDVAFSE
jgi:hypothetical protein